MIEKIEIVRKIYKDEDFIKSPKYDNSLAKYIDQDFFDGATNSAIARLLSLTEEEVEELYQEAVEMLRKVMVKDEN